IDKVYHEPAFKDSERVKLVEVESKLLSSFHGRPTHLRAAVILPKSYGKDPQKRYPVVYEIPGFGGTHTMAHALAARRDPTNVDGEEVLWVVLDPSTRWGHHVFADSPNNGPCGRALIEELIPALEKKHRGLGLPAGRFVTGHSSGGWSSLWLQVTYPDFFGGCWSTAPDSVDFRDFQKVNVYEDDSLFVDKEGKLRPLARKGAKPILFTKNFCDMEVVLGHGGQMGSFEAVFGPRGADGRPRPLWDRQSGKIDRDVAKTWEKYDIRLCLERNWDKLGPRLKGKVHVYMGGEDTFYLDGATALLKTSLAKLGSDAVIEIFPGKDHFTLMDK
ncbi:MAG: alpha/beta hydrolase-fold protein, partial [Gemmataceae bacterium]